MLQLIVHRGTLPAIAALAIALACRFLMPPDAARRDGLPFGIAGGFLLGYVLLPDWASLEPDRSWQWLPYITLIAACLGSLGFAAGVRSYERWAIQLTVALLAAYLLMPNWPQLQPVRSTYIVSLGASVFLLTALLEPLGARISSAWLTAMLALTAVVLAASIASEISMKMSEVTTVAASALLGCMVACLPSTALDVRSLIFPTVLLVGGLAFLAHLEPQSPRYSLLAIPMAPLALWIAVVHPIAGWRPVARITVASAAVVLVLAMSVIFSTIIGV